jgi:hypothetical protein
MFLSQELHGVFNQESICSTIIAYCAHSFKVETHALTATESHTSSILIPRVLINSIGLHKVVRRVKH